jgi:hypothetical protein
MQIKQNSQSGCHRGPRLTDANGTLAQILALDGIPVFPCAASGRRSKRPFIEHGHHAATTDRDTVQRWWKCWPDALVAIPTGPASGIWVLDVDGEVGRSSLAELMVRFCLTAISELTGCVSRTPSGGLHLIFRLQSGERPT